jgi:hypothetical protein
MIYCTCDFMIMRKFNPLLRWLSLFVIAAVLIAPFQTWLAYAQSTDEISWTTPVNLSNSGLTTLPAIVSDQNGVVHVVWNDDTLGPMVSELLDGAWSQPAAIKVPFSDFAPVFVDGGNFIHAFWVNTNNSNLAYSRVAIDKFGTANWDRAKVLAKGVEDFKVVYQPDNTLHLVYMTSFEDSKNLAGTYYLRSLDNGTRWDAAKPIYTSRYFRALDANTTNVDIAATQQDGKQAVYAVWNNPALKRVYLSKSLDGGENWDTPVEVDGPSDTNTTSSPYNPMVTASGPGVLLLWQSNLQSGFACSQYYQWSDDGGATWGDRARMLTEFIGCPQENLLINTGVDYTLLQTTIRDETYLLAWNGQMWSKAIPQSTLSGFTDSLTNEPVTFGCRQSSLSQGKTLFVVGCNEEGNADIWVTSREIGSVETWFPSTSLWDDPQIVVESEEEISSVQSIVDVHDVFHILWLQVDSKADKDLQRSIHYARLKDDQLSQPARILVSADRVVEDFSVAYDKFRDRLIVVWTTGTTGQLYYSWADISRAASTFEWSKAVELPTVSALAKSPNLLVTPDGTIYVAYAIPVNEGRGIYYVSSNDGGETWGETSQLYAVTEPGWQVIDSPKMASSGDDVLHVLWRRDRIFGDAGAVGLYYARSEDRGQTWSTPQIVSNDPIQAAWIVDAADEGLHRFWLTSLEAENSLFHDASVEQGINWRVQDNLTGFGEIPGTASPFVNSLGKVNIAQASENSPGNLVINHQEDDNGLWTILDSLVLGDGFVSEITSLAAQEMASGRLVLAYTFNQTQPAEGELPYRLYLATQSKDAVQITATAEAQSATLITATATPVATVKPTQPAETPAPVVSSPSPSPFVPLSTSAPAAPGANIDTATGIALSGGLAVLVVVVFFVYNRLRRP